MADYISREALIAFLQNEARGCRESFEELGGESGIVAETLHDLIDDIRHLPAAEVEPVRHGRWVALDDEFEESDDQDEALRWGCSACHEVVEYDDWTHRSGLTKFCPNCGAKMDEEVADGK